MISVIIINFNGRHLLLNCISSVEKHTPHSTEIIVFDNGSKDGSADFVEQHFSNVRLIRSKDNLGFVGGNNAAAKFASGTHLLLLNSDTIIESNLLPMKEILERDASIWVVGCKLRYANGQLQESIGHQLGPVRLALSWTPLANYFRFLRQKESRNSKIYDEEIIDCEYVSGACLMTPSNIWRDLGGLDSRYFMYMEDVDYCVRVRHGGGRVVYTASVAVTHLEGAGRPWIGQRAVLNTAISYTVYFRKFHGRLGRLVFGFMLTPVFLLRAAGHFIMHLIGTDPYGREKTQAYIRASLIILFGPEAPNTRY